MSGLFGWAFCIAHHLATLTNINGQQAKNADLTITMNRSDLETVMMGKATFDDQIKAGKAKLVGERKPYDELENMLVRRASRV